MTSTAALAAAEVAYQASQDAGFAYHVANSERRADRYVLHAAYDARWQEYLRLLRVAVTLVHQEHGIKEVSAA
jgi:hypothetical protein